MNETFMIEQRGKRFVLFAGLLDEAHNRGLQSIDTELIQAPCASNGEVAIVRAVVRMESGVFTGIGDASPANVGRSIAPHILRMAETRAKARALRDAINVSVAAFEELGGEPREGVDAEDTGSRSDRRPDKRGGESRRNQRSSGDPGRQSAGQNRSQGERGNVSDLPATRKQLNYLTTLIDDVSDEGGRAKFEESIGKKVAELTRDEASEWIGRLSGRSA